MFELIHDVLGDQVIVRFHLTSLVVRQQFSFQSQPLLRRRVGSNNKTGRSRETSDKNAEYLHLQAKSSYNRHICISVGCGQSGNFSFHDITILMIRYALAKSPSSKALKKVFLATIMFMFFPFEVRTWKGMEESALPSRG